MNHTEYINNLFSLEGRVGIVTGASRGIGMGIAKVLTDAGARVYGISRSGCSQADEVSGAVIEVKVDLTDYAATKRAIREIADREGHLDFLVNNAGISYKERAERFPEERYQMIQKVNLEALFEISRQAFPYLKQSEYIGRIVNITSMAAHMGFDGVVPYCMTKSGVTGLTRGLAEEWKKDNILVNSVAPGWCLTKLNEEMFENNPDRKAASLSKITLGRFGYPEEIGHMVLFLLSQASVYLTGQEFAVDGGALTHGY
jgi:NAD(P)-dependent dehydrogenase (short-subunit alcohol dehydrogenase family)